MLHRMFSERAGGILLHPTSLPGKYGIGSLGAEAFQFADFLRDAGQKLWQVLPLGHTGYGDSPYQCFSAFAGNPLLICPQKLADEGLLTRNDFPRHPGFSDRKVAYGKVASYKNAVLENAYRCFSSSAGRKDRKGFEDYCRVQKKWLDDYSFFMAVKEIHSGRPWWEWDRDIRFRTPYGIKKYAALTAQRQDYFRFLQYQFHRQWNAVRQYANRNGVRIIGDIPIFVSLDSSDAWAFPELFHLDRNLMPVKVAGVPPDYFSKTGQLWGNPLYRWDVLKKKKYPWWIDRFRSALEQTDIIRLDHFRGFSGFWAVPAGQTTAINGRWEKGPGADLFHVVEKKLGRLPVIAEDLGVITPDVVKLRDAFAFPGMKILQFAFDSGEKNNYLPHFYPPHCVVYTGTHDNDTSAGWFRKASSADRRFAAEYLQIGGACAARTAAWKMIRAAWSSVAVFSVAPLQDVLCLGSEARMNTPSTPAGNWQWRFQSRQLTDRVARRLKSLSDTYGR